MKTPRFVASVTSSAVLCAALLSAVTVVSAQSAAPSDGEKSFTLLKSLAGTWKGPVTTDSKDMDMEGKPIWITLRVTSRGNAVVHEMKEPGTPDDPKRDDPITMLYLDERRLYLTHYCDAGNRPRMVARTSPDGKTVEFDFVDLAGDTQYGHMHHVVFTFIDANHHTEDWTYMTPGDKPANAVHAHLDLQRAR
jgi:hypothetical protein